MRKYTHSCSRNFEGTLHIRFAISVLIVFLSFTVFTQCASKKEMPAAGENQKTLLKDSWGLNPVSIRITAAGHFVDFRYTVTDPERAASLMDGKLKSYLIHQETGKVLPVPNTKLGPLRAKAVKPKKGKQYSILFNNTPMVVQKGDKVTVAIGEFRSKDLIVE